MENNNFNLEENFSLQKELAKYTIYWKWFLLAAFLSLVLAYGFLKFSSPVYDNITTILIKDANEGRGLSELAAFQDLGLGSSNNDIDDEVDIIKSKALLTKVVTKLDVNIEQYAKVGLANSDIYSFSPINVSFKWFSNIREDDYESIGDIEIQILSEQEFLFIDHELDIEKQYAYGQPINLEQGVLNIKKNKLFEVNLNSEEPINEINIVVYPLNVYVSKLSNDILAAPKSKRSSILDISMKLSNRNKARDILNELVAIYNQEAVDDKNLVSNNTLSFISERLDIIAKELESVESEKAAFKKGKKLTDIKSEAEIFVGEVSESQKRLLGIETQLDLTNSMIEYLSNPNKNLTLLPSNIGLDDPNISISIGEYNKLILERNRLLGTSTELNPLVMDLTADIESQKINLLETLKNKRRNILITKKDYQREQSKINSKISTIPKIEKDFRVIERQQKIKESLYLFLLEKREETSISMAVTAPVAKVIDRAYSSTRPVSPKKKIILLAGLLLGLLVPFGVIYTKDLLDTKIHSKQDVEHEIKGIPVLSELPRIKRNQKDVVGRNDRSPLGESFRILTTNLDYFSRGKHIDGKALNIFVTSTIKGEGKTFVSYNLCLALAEGGNKILIVGADIRNPQLHRFEQPEIKKPKGLSEFLYDDSLVPDDVITSVNHNEINVDVVFSGRIPPNPTELLNNGRLGELVEQVSGDYDIIIVDTAPTMLVTDTLLISKIANITLYVTRAGFTDTRLLQYPKQLQEEQKLKGLAFVINDVKENNLGYGTKYGYGYGEEVEEKWYKKLFKRS
ncbi:GumC family protein [Aquimarina agarivorans]|uniref:GumC family protein n=1 Tax=Aquimarina agarivorans TaxID=980584 RepID=UPI000248EC10|nr:polysaccharide biosynthesis tyrosine autokinase [Aquimarina agarivorans]